MLQIWTCIFLTISFYLEGRPQKEGWRISSPAKNICVNMVREIISSLRSSLLPFSLELSLLALSVHPLSFTLQH